MKFDYTLNSTSAYMFYALQLKRQPNWPFFFDELH